MSSPRTSTIAPQSTVRLHTECAPQESYQMSPCDLSFPDGERKADRASFILMCFPSGRCMANLTTMRLR
jgi:hypothetical protein